MVVRAANRLTKRRVMFNQMTFAPDVGIVRIQTWMVEDGDHHIPQVDLKLTEYDIPSADRQAATLSEAATP